jgi:hypothetical protein
MNRTFAVVGFLTLAAAGCHHTGHGSLAIPGSVQGELRQGDRVMPDGSLADDHTVWLTQGQPVTIVVRGGPSTSSPGMNLDVYTILLFNNREVTHDDDSAGNLNSRIIYTPTQTGMYTVRVNTFGPGMRTGSYSVQTWVGANPNAV